MTNSNLVRRPSRKANPAAVGADNWRHFRGAVVASGRPSTYRMFHQRSDRAQQTISQSREFGFNRRSPTAVRPMKETQNNTDPLAKQTAVRTASPGAEISSRKSVRASTKIRTIHDEIPYLTSFRCVMGKALRPGSKRGDTLPTKHSNTRHRCAHDSLLLHPDGS